MVLIRPADACSYEQWIPRQIVVAFNSQDCMLQRYQHE